MKLLTLVTFQSQRIGAGLSPREHLVGAWNMPLFWVSLNFVDPFLLATLGYMQDRKGDQAIFNQT